MLHNPAPGGVAPDQKPSRSIKVYLNERIRRYERFANLAYDILKETKGVLVNRPMALFI